MAEATSKQGFNLGEFLQKNFLAIVILIGLILWYTRKPSPIAGQLISSDTTRTQVLQPIVVNPAYQPSQSGATVYVPVGQQYQPVQPSANIDDLIKQVIELSNSRAELAREFMAEKTYKDSITLKDSTGLRVGVVNLDQLVSENTLKRTQSSYQLLFPNTTITNTMSAKLKNQWFFGASVQSPIQVPSVQQVNMGLIIKNKRDNILSLSGTYNIKTQQPGIQAGYYQKLSFGKLIPKIPIP